MKETILIGKISTAAFVAKFSLNKYSRHVDVLFDVDRASFDVIERFDAKAGPDDEVRNFVDGEKVGHRSVLPDVVAFAHFCVGFEPEKAVDSRGCTLVGVLLDD